VQLQHPEQERRRDGGAGVGTAPVNEGRSLSGRPGDAQLDCTLGRWIHPPRLDGARPRGTPAPGLGVPGGRGWGRGWWGSRSPHVGEPMTNYLDGYMEVHARRDQLPRQLSQGAVILWRPDSGDEAIAPKGSRKKGGRSS